MKAIKFAILLLFTFAINIEAVILPKYGGLLKFAVFQSTLCLDPAKIQTNTEKCIAGNIFDGLVRYSRGKRLSPAVASSWDRSDDGKTWTFRLSESARFHNGRKVNASDIKFSWQRSLKHASDELLAECSLGSIKGAIRYRLGKQSEVDGIQILEDNTIRILLDQSDDYFLAGLTSAPAWIVPREALEKSDFDSRPTGCGPFRCVSATKKIDGEMLRLEAYKDYAYGRPYLDGIVFIYFSDFASALLQFEITDGDVDCLELPNIRFSKRSSNLMTISDNRSVYLHINNASPALKNKQAIRRSLPEIIKYGIDTKSILQMLYDQGSHISSKYNPDKAKMIIGDNRINIGRLIVIKCFPDLAEQDDDAFQISRRIELDLSKIRVDIAVTPLEPKDFRKSISDKSYTLALHIFSSSFANRNLLDSLYMPLFNQNTNILLRPNIFGLADSAPNNILQLDEVYLDLSSAD